MACGLLADLHGGKPRTYNLRHPRPELDSAVELAHKACDLDAGEGCYVLGEMAYPNAEYGRFEMFEKDIPTAIEFYQKGCDFGNERSCSALMLHALSIGDDARVLELDIHICRTTGYCEPLLYKQIMDNKAQNVARQGALGAALAPLDAEFKPEWHGAIRRLSESCKSGYFRDCVMLGDLYVEEAPYAAMFSENYRDNVSAKALFLHACDAGSGLGCARYANRLFRADPKPVVEVLEYAKKGCDQGAALGCVQACDVFLGLEAPSDADLDEAATYYLRACHLGTKHTCDWWHGSQFESDTLRLEWDMKSCVLGKTHACEFLAKREFARDRNYGDLLLGFGCEDGSRKACRELRNN